MAGPVIETPKGKIVINQHGRAELTFNPNYKPKWYRRFSKIQIYVDSQVIELCEPYTPLLTSMLIKSGTLGTDPGSGLVQWIAPYARRRYYMDKPIGSETGPLRGSYWFERMKAVHRDNIIDGARKFVGKN